MASWSLMVSSDVWMVSAGMEALGGTEEGTAALGIETARWSSLRREDRTCRQCTRLVRQLLPFHTMLLCNRGG